MVRNLRSFQVLTQAAKIPTVTDGGTAWGPLHPQLDTVIAQAASLAGPPAGPVCEIGPAHPKIGATLRAARELRQMRLKEISETLRIREAYLEAMETDRFEELPGPPYTIGFIRTYAKHLGLDDKNIVAQFRAGQPDVKMPIALDLERGRGHSFPLSGRALVALPLVLAVAIFGYWMAVNFDGDDRSVSMSDAELGRVTPQAIAAGSHATVAPAPPIVPSTVAPVDLPVFEAVAAKIEDAETQPLISSTSAQAAEVATDENGDQIANFTQAPDLANRLAKFDRGDVFGSNDGTNRIVLVALKQTWIQIGDAKGNIFFSQTLVTGDRYYVADRAGLLLIAGNAGGLEIYLDGARLGPLGAAGRVYRNLPLDPMAVRRILGPDI
ncbi:MAG: DUF4115 domain-containing protein [Alphaproteobacteria bacterium]|nr:DUF4115 domain-containing protein [Alphaproteobacteria bacterium]